jgi:hypothetical protein
MNKHTLMIASLIAGGLMAAPMSAAAEPAATPADKVVCKRFVPVGSLGRTKKVCKAHAEWQREREAAQEEGQRLTTTMSGQREVAELRPAGLPQ